MTFRPITLGLAATLFTTLAQATTVYSLAGDFSNASNPNGAWSFTQGSTPLAHFFPSTPNGLNPALANGYWGTGSDLNTNTPEVGKTTLNGSAVGYTDADFLSGDVILHSTNPGTGAAVAVNWTAPADGSIDVTGLTWYAHSAVSRSNDFVVTLGAATLGTGVVSNTLHAGSANALPFSFSGLSVSAGTVLTLSYTPSAGQPFGSIAGLSETVTFTPSPVPEASTWAALTVGLALLGVQVRRRAPGAA
jgi:hypothetical protein